MKMTLSTRFRVAASTGEAMVVAGESVRKAAERAGSRSEQKNKTEQFKCQG